MGFIRGSLAFIICVVLFISLLLTSIFLTLSWSSDYDVLKAGVSDYAVIFLGTNPFFNLDENMQEMREDCKFNSNYIINDENLKLEIPCEIVNQGQEKVVEYGVNKTVYDYYYKNYDCEFLSCLQEGKNFFVLFSLKAHDFWKYYFYILLIISSILFGFLFLSVKNKSNSFIVVGILLILNSMILKAISFLINWIPEKIVSDLTNLFISKSHLVFLVFLILGVLFIIVGIAIKLISKGSKISEEVLKGKENKGKSESKIIDEKVKKEIKKEIKNLNKKKSK